MKIEIGTYDDKGNQSIPYSLEAWGNKAEGKIGRTGRGLKLGDSSENVRRIYGKRFLYNKNNDGTSQIKIQWQDETETGLIF